MKVKDLTLKIVVPKPRDPNQVVLAAKKNAGGAMRDKKQALKRGDFKHKGRAFEDQEILEGRRHVYGPGDNELIDHPNETMQAIGNGETVKVMTKSGVAKIEKVQFYNGGLMFKLDREVKLEDGSKSAWVSDRDVLLDLEKGAAPDAKVYARKHAMGEETVMEKRPAGAPKWHDSDAPDANGKFKELGVNDLADWLIKTRGGDARKIHGSINQQIVFNRKKNPTFAKKMEGVREAVKRKMAAKTNESLTEELELLAEGWRNHKDGQGTFTADMSMIDHHQGSGGTLKCPGCKVKINLRNFKAHRDGENDITHWSLNHECGAKLKVWNT